MEKNELEAAIADFTRAVEIQPRHFLAWANRGLAREKLARPGALEDYREALRHAPRDWEARPQIEQAVKRLKENP
jgi:regulator of sirC expression with transglutaminase-like and TPR domain